MNQSNSCKFDEFAGFSRSSYEKARNCGAAVAKDSDFRGVSLPGIALRQDDFSRMKALEITIWEK